MTKDNVVLIDLDETLITTNYRQYKVINSFLSEKKINNPFCFKDYIKIRKESSLSNLQFFSLIIKEKEILEDFKKFYYYNIETTHFLHFDERIVDLTLLTEYSKNKNLIILSLRSNPLTSILQLEQLKLKDFFKEIIFLKHNKLINPKIKAIKELKNKYIVESFIGDSKSDFKAAKKNNINFIKVNTGLFDFEFNGDTFSSINSYIKNAEV